MKHFNLNKEEYAKFVEWNTEHLKLHDPPGVAIGGRLTFSFTPTGLGTIIRVTCACGASCTLTDSGEW